LTVYRVIIVIIMLQNFKEPLEKLAKQIP